MMFCTSLPVMTVVPKRPILLAVPVPVPVTPPTWTKSPTLKGRSTRMKTPAREVRQRAAPG